MDTVPRRRRASGTGEPEGDSAALEAAYQTALSQTTAVDPASLVGMRGEASPGTLEMGRGSGVTEAEQLPVANPFHSEHVQNEIQLIRSRPPTLDEEGQRIRGQVSSSAAEARVLAECWVDESNVEPDYTTAFQMKEQPGPRVARVEAAGEAVDPSSDRSLPASPTEVGRVPVAVTACPGGKVEEAQDNAPTSAAGAGDEELVPDSGNKGGMEVMLMQILEENRSLKRRLEQVELRSHSSWHTGTTAEPVLAGSSPMSFAPCGARTTEHRVSGMVAGGLSDVQGRASPEAMMVSSYLPASQGQIPRQGLIQGNPLESPNLSGVGTGTQALGLSSSSSRGFEEGTRGLALIPFKDSQVPPLIGEAVSTGGFDVSRAVYEAVYRAGFRDISRVSYS